jgi:hypothetical protein
MFIFSPTVIQALSISTSESKFYKDVNLFKISTWYCCLPSISFNFFRLYLCIWNLCIVCLLTASLSLTFATTRQWSTSQSAALNDQTSSILECHLLPIKIWSIWLWDFPSEDVQVNLWMLQWRNMYLWQIFGCSKVYYSNSIIIINFA